MAKTYDRIRLGVSQLVWGIDLSRPDRLVRCLDDAAVIGYEGVLCFDTTVNFWVTRPAEFRALLQSRRLDLTGVILRPGLDFAATTRLARWMAEVGGDVMVISGRCGTEADRKIVLPILERHGELAATHGIRAVYHHHTGWIAETMEQTERLLADTDPRFLGGMLDCGHATKDFVGHTAQEYYRRNHARIDYVEFKDWASETDLNTEVGRGRCDFPAVVAALKDHAYRGWIVVEQNGPKTDPKASAAESYRYIGERLGIDTRRP